MVYVNKGIS